VPGRETIDGLRVETHSILFADVKGYSSLSEFELRQFFMQVLPRIAKTFQENDAWGTNSWGDGFAALFSAPAGAARCGLSIRDIFARENWSRYGLPNSLSVRVGLHAAPIFIGYDPIRQTEGVVGSQVTLAARLEPIVPPNRTFATTTFVELLKRNDDERLAWDEVGITELAKGWGAEGLYNLRWANEPRFSLDQLGATAIDELRDCLQKRSPIELPLVDKIRAAGRLRDAVEEACKSDNSVGLRQLASILLQVGDIEEATLVVRTMPNRAERRTSALKAIQLFAEGTSEPALLNFVTFVYSIVRDPQRRDLREAAESRGIAIEWPVLPPAP
jgi:class 3 adenylate cyclase